MFKKIFSKLFSNQINSIAVEKLQNAAQAIAGYTSHNYFSGGQSAGAKWPYGLSSSGTGRIINHYAMRRNARNAYQENPQARGIVDRYADTVADIGLRFESTPNANILGISPEQAEKWGRNVESRFDLWARSKDQHRAGNMTWYQSHRLYQIFQQRDNDIFTRLYYSPDRNLLNPLQFNFLDPDQIRGDAFTSTYGIHSRNDGIVRDEQGRETAYKVWIRKEDYKFDSVDIPRKVGRRLIMLHGFAPEYAGQGRGYSRLGYAIQDFENLTDLSSAQIKKAINQSLIAMFVKPGPDQPASNPFEGVLTRFGAGPAAEQFGSNPTPSDGAQNVTDESRAPLSCYSIPEATFNQPGSAVLFGLDKAEELKPFLTAPADDYDKFVDSFTSYLTAADSMPLEVLLMKFGANYSASRGALILFWRVVNIWREEMSADYLNPIISMWVAGEIATNRIQAPGWSDPIMRAAWLHGNWYGSPMPNIDPMRTAKADKTYIEMGAQDLDKVARNLNGSDGSSNRAKLRRQYTELELPPWVKKPEDGGDGGNG